MSNLESIVPPLELCKLIPAGEFEDSAMTWYNFHGVPILRWRDNLEKLTGVRPIPAPTLEEILTKLRDITEQPGVYCGRITGLFVCDSKEFLTPIKDASGAAAAIRLWFKVKGIEVK